MYLFEHVNKCFVAGRITRGGWIAPRWAVACTARNHEDESCSPISRAAPEGTEMSQQANVNETLPLQGDAINELLSSTTERPSGPRTAWVYPMQAG